MTIAVRSVWEVLHSRLAKNKTGGEVWMTIRREIENFLTFLSFCFLDAFGRPVTGRKSKRGDGNTSDQGTGDEATLPRTEERQEKKKKKSGIQRSRSTQRSCLVSTPNVSFEVHKKQLFSGRRLGERRDIGN